MKKLICMFALLALCLSFAEAQESSPAEPPPEVHTVDDTSWVGQVFGWGMWPLWICSIVLATLAIDRARALRANLIIDPNMFDQVANHAENLQWEEARQAAENSSTVAGIAWAKGIREFSLGGISLAEALTNASLVALKPLKKNLQAISTIAAIAPLFGLLGTIIGMIMAFSRIAETGGADKSQLAGAISLALFTTAGGLLVAIPAIILGRYFSAKLLGYSEQIEAAINEVNHRYQHARANAQE